MTASLVEKRIVVTGARGGIGARSVAKLRAAGARVAGIDLRPGDGIEMADVTDRTSVEDAIERIVERIGGIDILINNAGIGMPHDSGDFPDAAARATMEVNFFGAWTTTAAAMPHLLRLRGHVVNVSSGLAIVSIPFAAAYSASKRALDAYSDALRTEYMGRITVTTLHPGYIRTSIHDASSAAGAGLEGLVRPDTVEQAARAVVRACSIRPRSLSSSRRSDLELWAARRFPRTVGMVLARRFERWSRTASPAFLRFPAG